MYRMRYISDSDLIGALYRKLIKHISASAGKPR
jgi:hypothetical protein